jgi:hypothetical protein
MVRIANRLYSFFITLPNRLYPFSCEIAGKRVRFRRAYDEALLEVRSRRGDGHYGAGLFAYREVFHVTGALLFILFATLVSKELFGSDIALYVLFALAALAIAFQEFYLQPRTLGQLRTKGIVDWLSWVVPFGVYLFVHLH